MSTDDTTIVLTDIRAALQASEKEAFQKPAALLVVGGDLNGTLFDLVVSQVSIGRNADNTIPLEFNGVSRYHFKLLENGETHILEDCGSKNGTYLNNKKVEGLTPLAKGTSLKLEVLPLNIFPKVILKD